MEKKSSILLHMPPEVKEQLHKLAKRQRRSMTGTLVHLIEQAYRRTFQEG
jgi:predicted DNA-binding protein